MSNDDKRRYMILKDPNIAKGLFIMALPVMLNNFIRTFHDLIDMFFVGRIAEFGKESIAAIQITFPITFMYIALAMGLGIAGTALISQLHGNNQIEQAKKYSAQLVYISVLLGILLNVLAFFMAEPIMRLMGAEGYTLIAREIDLEGGKCLLSLYKDGIGLDTEIVQDNATYKFI